MTTLIVPSHDLTDERRIIKAATQVGWKILRWSNRNALDTDQAGDWVYYGSVLEAEQVIQQIPIVLLEPPFDWLAKIPWNYRQREVAVSTVAEARRVEQPIFVKALDPARKVFDAGVFPGGFALPWKRGFPEETPVLVAEPVTYEVEYRCVLLDADVQTLAPYVRQGRWLRRGDHSWQPSMREEYAVRAFCFQVMRDSALAIPPAVVMDVGLVEDRGWCIVELNPIWASGLYGCDAERVLPALKRACIVADRVTDPDWRWVHRPL